MDSRFVNSPDYDAQSSMKTAVDTQTGFEKKMRLNSEVKYRNVIKKFVQITGKLNTNILIAFE